MAVLRVGRSGGLEHQHGSAIVVPSALLDMNHWRWRSGLAIVFRATRWRGRSYADHRVRRGAMARLWWPPAIETSPLRSPQACSSESEKRSLRRRTQHDRVPRNPIVRSAAPGLSLAWHCDDAGPRRRTIAFRRRPSVDVARTEQALAPPLAGKEGRRPEPDHRRLRDAHLWRISGADNCRDGRPALLLTRRFCNRRLGE